MEVQTFSKRINKTKGIHSSGKFASNYKIIVFLFFFNLKVSTDKTQYFLANFQKIQTILYNLSKM